MSLSKEQISAWLRTLPPGTAVSIDEGGLTLVADMPTEDKAWLEVGGEPLPLFTNRYKCARCGEAWQNEDDCTCDDRCPKCNQSTSPYESVDA